MASGLSGFGRTLAQGIKRLDVLTTIRRQLGFGLDRTDADAPSEQASPRQLEVNDTTELWIDLLAGRITVGQPVRLVDVTVFEWVPRAPGLFHTASAAAHREYVDEHLQQMVEVHDDQAMLSVNGKMRMLRGGFGCVRLPRFPANSRCVLGASSSTVAHEGFIVLMSHQHRAQIQADLERHGGVTCTLEGRLVSLPSRFVRLYDLPRVGMRVETSTPRPQQTQSPSVTAAVLFEHDALGTTACGGTFATVDPANAASMAEGLEFLRHYADRFEAKVIVDFDSEAKGFPEAHFSLAKLADPQLDEALHGRLAAFEKRLTRPSRLGQEELAHVDATWRQDASTFMARSFQVPGELRSFVVALLRSLDQDALVPEMPNPQGSAADLAVAVVEWLNRHGLLGPALLDGLAVRFPEERELRILRRALSRSRSALR